jgi:hypothetical protein
MRTFLGIKNSKPLDLSLKEVESVKIIKKNYARMVALNRTYFAL